MNRRGSTAAIPFTWAVSGSGAQPADASDFADGVLPAGTGMFAREVRSDLEAYFARLAPESDIYRHDDEGPDDMPAHLRTALTGVSLSIPLAGSGLALGTWQGIYLFEHRRHPHRRTLAVYILGE